MNAYRSATASPPSSSSTASTASTSRTMTARFPISRTSWSTPGRPRTAAPTICKPWAAASRNSSPNSKRARRPKPSAACCHDYNKPDGLMSEGGNAFYMSIMKFGAGADQPGAILNGRWYTRNAMIFSKLAAGRKTRRPHHRHLRRRPQLLAAQSRETDARLQARRSDGLPADELTERSRQFPTIRVRGSATSSSPAGSAMPCFRIASRTSPRSSRTLTSLGASLCAATTSSHASGSRFCFISA